MYAELEIAKDDMFGPRGFYEEKGGRFEARPAMVRLLEEFAARCRAGGVQTLSEGGLSPAAYYDSVKRFVDVQVEGNLAFRRPVSGRSAPGREIRPGRPRRPDQRRPGRGRLQGPLARLGRRRCRADARSRAAGLGPRDRAEHALGLPQLDPPSGERRLLGVRRRPLVPRGGAKALARRPPGRGLVRTFSWTEDMAAPGLLAAVRYVRFRIEGTRRLPDWHASAGGLSWVFVDEIVVR